jgi:hypothetical protein
MAIWREAPTDVRPHTGAGWLERSGAVGTADERNSYLFQRRVALQLRIEQLQDAKCPYCTIAPITTSDGRHCYRCGSKVTFVPKDVIADARCYLENDETDAAGSKLLAISAANLLIGKTLADAARLGDDAFAVADAKWFDGCNGRPFLIADAVRAAVLDWADKATGRRERVPYDLTPPDAPDLGILTPFGRFLARLGL